MSCLRFAPTCVVVSGDGVSATTVTFSWTVATDIVTSSGTVPPSTTVTDFSTLPKPDISKVTLYGPGGSALKMYPPLVSVTAVRVPRRAGDFTETVTPGRGCLSDDNTDPLSVAVCVPCAKAATAVASTMSTAGQK
jgi:hypothetical protein